MQRVVVFLAGRRTPVRGQCDMAVTFRKGARILLVSAIPSSLLGVASAIAKLGDVSEEQFTRLLKANRLETGLSFGERDTLQISWGFQEHFGRRMRWYNYKDGTGVTKDRPKPCVRGDYLLVMCAAYRSGG